MASSEEAGGAAGVGDRAASSSRHLSMPWSFPPFEAPVKADASGVHGDSKRAEAAPDVPFLTSMTSAVSVPVSPRGDASGSISAADELVADEDGCPRLARISSCSNRKLAFHRQLLADEDSGTRRCGSADLDESDDDGDRELDAGQRHLRFIRASSLLEDALGLRSSTSAPLPAATARHEEAKDGGVTDEAAAGVAEASTASAEAPALPSSSGEITPALSRKGSGLAALTRRPSRLGPRTQQVLAALHLSGRTPKTSRRDEVTRRSTALIPATPATPSSASESADGTVRSSVEVAGQELLRRASGGRTKVLLVSAAAALRRVPSLRRPTSDGGSSAAAAAVAPSDGTTRRMATDSPPGSDALTGSSGRLTVDSTSSSSLNYSAWAPSTAASSRSSLLFEEDADARPNAARRAGSHRPSRFEMLSATSSPRYSYSWQDSDTDSDVDAPFVRRRNTASGVVGPAGGKSVGVSSAAAGKAVRASAAPAGAPTKDARAGEDDANEGGGGGSVAARLQMWEARE
ncbi:hypothetical protein MMPV_003624 [Pyropia vietnamensis]